MKKEDITDYICEKPTWNASITKKFEVWKKQQVVRSQYSYLRGQLNEEQFAVVSNLGGNMLVLAGAGSGKTRTISYAVYKLIQDSYLFT